jgi:hypothetical protein
MTIDYSQFTRDERVQAVEILEQLLDRLKRNRSKGDAQARKDLQTQIDALRSTTAGT